MSEPMQGSFPLIRPSVGGGGAGWRLFDRLDAMPALSAEEIQILESVQSLARDRIAPRAAHYDRTAEFPWDNIRAINALGLNAMFVPEAYGGAGLGYAGLSRLRARDQPGLRLDRHHLGDEFPRDKAADRFRDRGAEAPAAAARRRRRARGAGDHRARCRLRRDPDDDAVRSRPATMSSYRAARPSSPMAMSPI